MAPHLCGVKRCGKALAEESLFCAPHKEVYLASEEARWPQPTDFSELEWEVIRQLTFAIWASTVGWPGLAVPSETAESKTQRAKRFEICSAVVRDDRRRLTQR